jgi:hypothetical protein
MKIWAFPGHFFKKKKVDMQESTSPRKCLWVLEKSVLTFFAKEISEEFHLHLHLFT